MHCQSLCYVLTRTLLCPACTLGVVNFSEDNLSLRFSMCLPACPRPTLEHLRHIAGHKGQRKGLCPSVRTGFRVRCLLHALQAACPWLTFPALLPFCPQHLPGYRLPTAGTGLFPSSTDCAAPLPSLLGWQMFCRPGAAGASAASAQCSLAWSSAPLLDQHPFLSLTFKYKRCLVPWGLVFPLEKCLKFFWFCYHLQKPEESTYGSSID